MIAWALANWGKVIVGIVILSITIYIGVLKFQLGSARGEAAELRGKVSELNSEIAGWRQTYDVMSQVIEKQSKANKILEEKRKQAVAKRAESDKRASAIVAQAKDTETRLKAVQAPASTCDEELSKIRQLLDTAE